MSGLVFTVPLIVAVVFVFIVLFLIDDEGQALPDSTPGDDPPAAVAERCRGPPRPAVCRGPPKARRRNRPYPLTPSYRPRRRRAQAHQPPARAQTEETLMIEVANANAVLDLTHWLASVPDGFRAQVTDAEALDALRHMVRRASELLSQTNPAEHADALVDRLAVRRASDAAAQAFCAAVDEHHGHNGVMPPWAEERYQVWKAVDTHAR